jgi:hypothetical protein
VTSSQAIPETSEWVGFLRDTFVFRSGKDSWLIFKIPPKEEEPFRPLEGRGTVPLNTFYPLQRQDWSVQDLGNFLV